MIHFVVKVVEYNLGTLKSCGNYHNYTVTVW